MRWIRLASAAAKVGGMDAKGIARLLRRSERLLLDPGAQTRPPPRERAAASLRGRHVAPRSRWRTASGRPRRSTGARARTAGSAAFAAIRSKERVDFRRHRLPVRQANVRPASNCIMTRGHSSKRGAWAASVRAPTAMCQSASGSAFVCATRNPAASIRRSCAPPASTIAVAAAIGAAGCSGRSDHASCRRRHFSSAGMSRAGELAFEIRPGLLPS